MYEFSGVANYLLTCVTKAEYLIDETAVTEHNGVLKDNSNVENYVHEMSLVLYKKMLKKILILC